MMHLIWSFGLLAASSYALVEQSANGGYVFDGSDIIKIGEGDHTRFLSVGCVRLEEMLDTMVPSTNCFCLITPYNRPDGFMGTPFPQPFVCSPGPRSLLKETKGGPDMCPDESKCELHINQDYWLKLDYVKEAGAKVSTEGCHTQLHQVPFEVLEKRVAVAKAHKTHHLRRGSKRGDDFGLGYHSDDTRTITPGTPAPALYPRVCPKLPDRPSYDERLHMFEDDYSDTEDYYRERTRSMK